ncbi:MAG: glycerol 3-phosphate dehydrogenase [Massilia sp.]|jgi:glycerol-3-phosphate dehydrogenase (NAD(P)+)|nr:glycerol 3-phosphate dehydrogenase [Massilia sp.]
MDISVLGAGAWGTALAMVFAKKHTVTLWTRAAQHAADMQAQRENRHYLPGFALAPNIAVTADFNAAIDGAGLVIIATPVAGLREMATRLKEARCGASLVGTCKGFELGSGLLPHQVVRGVIGETVRYGALCGPSFAQEVAAGKPTAVAFAAGDPEFTRAMTLELHGPGLRVYANHDLVGVEVAGAIKNVLAIAAGICDGLDLGLNARAALVTRGLSEMSRLGAAMGAQRQSFLGLSGVGDVILTCTGNLSRNRSVGLGLGEGKPLAQILEELGHVAEGVHTARAVATLAARHKVEMPICSAISSVLDGQRTARNAVEELLARAPKEELL